MRIITLIFIFMSLSAFGFEVFPEYRSLQETEASSLEVAQKIDSEYNSDLLTFRNSYAWEGYWLAKKSGFDLSIGSISSKNFADTYRLKINQKLADQVRFKFIYFKQGDFDQNQEHSILELQYEFAPRWSLIAFGTTSFQKSEDDAGLAFQFNVSERSSHRIYTQFVDYSRNQRNESNDKFNESPKTYGYQWAFSNNVTHEFFKFDGRFETWTDWEFPDQNLRYLYRQRFFQYLQRYQVADGHYANIGLMYRSKFENNLSLSDGGASTNDFVQFQFTQAELEWEILHWVPRHEILARIHWSDRHWLTNNGNVRQQGLLPQLWWHLPYSQSKTAKRWGFGYEMTYHDAEGPSALRGELDKGHASEHRLNVLYEWKFKLSGRLKLLFTFDVDRFGSGETWEGGNGQFQIFW